MRGLYIHIPFCKHICSYCDFAKVVTFKIDKMKTYLDYLIKELKSYQEEIKSVDTIFIGGGTPNALPDDFLEQLLSNVLELTKNNQITEYSIECNPELVTDTQAAMFKKYGITRVSLGAESFNDKILLKLGRHHKKEDIINAVKIFKKHNLNNINVDLIFGHPYDTIDLVKENLKDFYNLSIPHISYYSMILEDKTIFKYLYDLKKIELPDEDIVADMYEYIMSDLKKHHYNQYEISNFAKDGYESLHNKIYWECDNYIGVGLAASGYLNNVRYTNSYNFDSYYKNIKEDEHKLSVFEAEQEFMMLGFRLIKGVSKSRFKNKFNCEIEDVFKEKIDYLINKKLIEEKEDHYCLTHEGIMLGNEVFMEFVDEE
ncbi:MAG: radical SAM family heme chaperone HemW [Acholeplasmatales bacterium]|nr:radical SAM family heme chaperone HemW [Acholeplasmatales bacterium]